MPWKPWHLDWKPLLIVKQAVAFTANAIFLKLSNIFMQWSGREGDGGGWWSISKLNKFYIRIICIGSTINYIIRSTSGKLN